LCADERNQLSRGWGSALPSAEASLLRTKGRSGLRRHSQGELDLRFAFRWGRHQESRKKTLHEQTSDLNRRG
jgi:hypothetical protein